MSGIPITPKGIRESRIQAAHNWLYRAEDQFASGQDVMAAATLMLAQAELKLMIESAMAEVPATTSVLDRAPKLKKRFAVSRNVLAVASMAACLVIGLVLGQYINHPAPTQPAGVIPTIVQTADEIPVTLEPPAADIAVEEPQYEELSGTMLANGPSQPVEITEPATEITAPIPTPRPVYRPRPEPEPSNIIIVPDVPEPIATVEETPSGTVPAQTNVVDIPSGNDGNDGNEINPAEVALRTIQALSQRLFLNHTNEPEM